MKKTASDNDLFQRIANIFHKSIKRTQPINICILIISFLIPYKMTGAYAPPYIPSTEYAPILTLYPATPTHFPLEPTDSIPFRYCLVSKPIDSYAGLGGLNNSSVQATETGYGILRFEVGHEYKRYDITSNLCPFNLIENSNGTYQIMFNRGPGYEGQSSSINYHNSVALNEPRPSYLASVSENGLMYVSIFPEDAINVTVEWDDENEAVIRYGDRVLRYAYRHNSCRPIFLNPDEYPVGSYRRILNENTTSEIQKFSLCMLKKTVPFNPCFRKTYEPLGSPDGLLPQKRLSSVTGIYHEYTFSVIPTENMPISVYVQPDTNHSLFVPFRVVGPETSNLAYYIDPYMEGMPQFYKEVRLMPTGSTTGSYTFSIIIDEDCDYSPDIALVGNQQNFYFNFLRKQYAHWSYGTSDEYVENLTITYNPSAEADNQLRLYVKEPLNSEFEDLTDSADLFTHNSNDYGEIGLTQSPNGSYHLTNSPIWDFSDGQTEITKTYKGGPLRSDSPYILGNCPDITLTVKPYKPTLELDFNEIPHSDVYDEEYIISIPQGCFEEGNEWSNSQYARLILIPQFKTFEHSDSATAHYGTEPRENIKDSWLSHKWYKQNNHDGFLPTMKWDPSSQTYDCYINPSNMTYVSWDGQESTGHHLVSGRYKAVLIPSLDPDARQYGIAPSDSIDFYIYPSFDDIKLGLCIRDQEDSEPFWKYYPMEYSWTSLITGPNGTSEHGQVAYGHSRLLPISDYSEIWYNNDPYNQGLYSQDRTLKTTEKEVTNAEIPKGYTKLVPDEYMDLSKTSSFNVMLAKNGAVTPEPMLIYVDKDENNEIITGIHIIHANHQDRQGAEYFTPAGIRVDDPAAPGIYVERINGKTRKVVLK